MKAPEACRPRIAVSGPDRGGWPAWFMTRLAIWRAGGRAIRITPDRPDRADRFDALVIGGGADVDPTLYRERVLKTIQKEHARSQRSRPGRAMEFTLAVILWLLRRLFSLSRYTSGIDEKRDRLEMALLDQAVQKNIPVLGICRGAQLINVYFGGTLFQEIDNFYVETPKLRTVLPKKLVHVETGTQLQSIVCGLRLKVNSLHNQSIKELGRGLMVTARETNGIIQAIEHTRYPFILGVQWHPEFLPVETEQVAIFTKLVEHARRMRDCAGQPQPSAPRPPRAADRIV